MMICNKLQTDESTNIAIYMISKSAGLLLNKEKIMINQWLWYSDMNTEIILQNSIAID